MKSGSDTFCYHRGNSQLMNLPMTRHEDSTPDVKMIWQKHALLEKDIKTMPHKTHALSTCHSLYHWSMMTTLGHFCRLILLCDFAVKFCPLPESCVVQNSSDVCFSIIFCWPPLHLYHRSPVLMHQWHMLLRAHIRMKWVVVLGDGYQWPLPWECNTYRGNERRSPG